MRRWIALCTCILILLAMPFAVTASPVDGYATTTTTANQTGKMANQTANMTVAGYIAQDQNLTRLAEALNITGLNATLDTGGPYTVFAPDNDAFNALGNKTVDRLFNETGNLTTVLKYHVVEGNYTTAKLMNMTENQTGNQSSSSLSDVLSGLVGGANQTGNVTKNVTTLKTLSGESLNVTVSDSKVMVENATVITKDINTTNGVIHVIDKVLVPPGLNLTVPENQTVTTGNTTMA